VDDDESNAPDQEGHELYHPRDELRVDEESDQSTLYLE
jgi:hypothetical protein